MDKLKVVIRPIISEEEKKLKRNAKSKDYRERNSEKVKAHDKTRRDANPEQVKAWHKTWRELNKAKLKADNKAWRIANPDKTKNSDLKKYGISLDDYNKKLKEQEYSCAICKRHKNDLKETLCVDHNHATGKVRKLLCRKCNLALGYFNDDVSIINNAIKYITEHE